MTSFLIRGLRNALVIYVGLCVVMGCLQDKLIFPGAATQGTEFARVPESKLYDLVQLRTADGDTIHAVFATATDRFRNPLPDAATRPTLIYFYGNGDCLSNSLGWVSYFRALGVNVLAVEYPGYGMATGKPGEKPLYAAADAGYDYLLTRPDVDRNKLIPTGVSLGCAVAIDLATRRPSAGIVAISPFTSMTAMGREAMPFLPTSLILKYKFDNAMKLQGYERPVFISHGRRDTVIPFWMGEKLATLPAAPVTFVPVDHADHNDVLEKGGDAFTQALQSFFERHWPSR